MKHILSVLLALGLAATVSADTAVCTATSQSPGTTCSASADSETGQLRCTCATAAAAPVVNPLTGFCTSFYKLADVNDAIGADHLTNSATPVTFSAGKIGNAANFVGASSEVLSASRAMTGGSMTFAAWFKTSSANNQYLVSWWDNTAGAFHLNISSGNVRVYSDVGHILATSGTNYADGAWHLAIGYHDSATGINTLIVDNGSPITVAGTTNVSSSTHTFAIGAFGGTGTYLTGSVDATCVAENAVPTAAQITALWNSGAGYEP